MADQTQPNVQDLIRKGQDIYSSRLKSELEPSNNGKYLAVEVDSEDHFIGDTREEAVAEARKKHPKKLLVIIRIGGIEKVNRYSPQFSSSF